MRSQITKDRFSAGQILVVLEKTWESLGCKEIQPVNPKGIGYLFLNIHWKDWCWSWNSKTLATWCEEWTHWKRPWWWARLKEGVDRDNRGWDGWMASPTQWTWVWVSSRSWWWTGKPGLLQSMGSQIVRHDWLNWTELWKTIISSEKTHKHTFFSFPLLYSFHIYFSCFSASTSHLRSGTHFVCILSLGQDNTIQLSLLAWLATNFTMKSTFCSFYL